MAFQVFPEEAEALDGFAFGHPDNARDVFLGGDCDFFSRALCDALGWRTDLEALMAAAKL